MWSTGIGSGLGKIVVFQKDVKDGAYPVWMTLIGWAGIMIFLITEMVAVERPPAVVGKHSGHEGRCQADADGDDGASRFERTVFCQGKHRDAGTCQWNVPTVLPVCKSSQKREGGGAGVARFVGRLGQAPGASFRARGPGARITRCPAAGSAGDRRTMARPLEYLPATACPPTCPP